jgi:hypothetical protein
MKKPRAAKLPDVQIACPKTAAMIAASTGKTRRAWASLLGAAEKMAAEDKSFRDTDNIVRRIRERARRRR